MVPAGRRDCESVVPRLGAGRTTRRSFVSLSLRPGETCGDPIALGLGHETTREKRAWARVFDHVIEDEKGRVSC